ncbi:MAG: hypothetical protein GY828_03245 [Candidatus Gracilibacteria bacterium]|nr:hypothetical protein [Candidatus Gracilibacteria bacterium]
MKKKYISLIFIFVTVSFLAYCFFPIFIVQQDESSQVGNIVIFDRNGNIITDVSTQEGYFKYIPIDYKNDFIQALIQIEDKDYYQHYGIDIFSKLGALQSNISAGKIVSGGSTITEQFIKNNYFLGEKRSYLQKAREATLAWYFSLGYMPDTLGLWKSREEKKDKILELYLNKIYFGNQNYGLGAAIETYFNKERIEDLTQEEMTLLLTLVRYPSIKSLEEKHFQKHFHRIKDKLGFSFERSIYSLTKKENINIIPWATEYTKQKNGGELEIGEYKNTIDSELQIYAKAVLNQILLELSDKNVTNGSVFALDPKSGEVLIYQASRDFYSQNIDGQFDVIQAQRQMGSTLKPFLYLLALDKGAGTESFLLDIEQEYNSFQNDKTYISNNYNLHNYGLIRLKKALGNSLNNASVRLSKELGLSEVYDWYQKFGFDFTYPAEHYGYSFVLGSPNISLENLVKSYALLLPKNGEKENSQQEKDMNINKFLLYDILSDPDNRDISFGVHSILNTSVPMAVKTGTSSNFRDNVVVSYHPNLVLGVWVGNNDNSSMQGVTGITGAGYIWHQIIEKSIELGYITDTFEAPVGLEETSYCLDENCFQKELIYTKKSDKYFSAIKDNYYDIQDSFIKITQQEKNILENMGIK